MITVVSLLSLGLAIDYGLLLVARYREELAAGRDRLDAVGRAWATAGRTILFSGLTVAGALTGLLLFDIPRLQAMGAAGMSVAVVALLAGLTFTAALLGAVARWVKPSKRALARAAVAATGLAAALFTRRLIALALTAAEHSAYSGNWALAVGASQLRGRRSYSYHQNWMSPTGSPYGEDTYRRAAIVSHADLLVTPGAVTSRLLARLLRALGTDALFTRVLTDPAAQTA